MKEVNNIHLKYVDDLSLAEAINLPEKLVEIPDMYHAYTGHVLPPTNSEVYNH